MDFVTLISTLVGAAVALAATVLADYLRNRGQRDRDNRTERRQSYVDFALALNGAHAALRLVADPRHVATDLRDEAASAVRENGLYEARERMLMGATRGVLGAAERAFLGLVMLRDAVSTGTKLRTPEYHNAYHDYADALWDLRRAIREDLDAGSIVPADLNKPSWDGRDMCDFCQGRRAHTP